MIDKTFSLHIGAAVPPLAVDCTEGDTAWRWHFQLYLSGARWTIPTGGAATFVGRKNDGNVFDITATISNNEVVVTANEQVTAYPGPVNCVVRVLDSYGKIVASCPVMLHCKPNPQSMGTLSDTVLSAYDDAAARLGDAIGVRQNVTDWLDEHISGEGNVAVDNSLSVSGAAADAKATGDAVDVLMSDLSINANNIYDRPNGKHSFTSLELGYYDRTTGVKKPYESDAPYVRSVEKIPVTNNVLVEYLDLPDNHARSDYGVIFVYWDSLLNYVGMTTQITTDATLTSIPENAAYIAIQIISKTSVEVTVENAPTVNISWFEYDEISNKLSFSNWLNHTSYSENENRLTYSQNSAFSGESYPVNSDLRYIVSSHSNTDISNIYVWEFAEDHTYIGGPRIYNATTGYTSFKPTQNTAYIRLSVNFSSTFSDPGYITLVKSDSANLLPSFGLYTNETQEDPDDSSKKISITWNGLESVKVAGVMSPAWNVYSHRIYYSASEFPDGIHAGDKLYVSFNNNDLLKSVRGELVVKSVCLTIMYFFEGNPNNRTTSQFVYDPVELDVPPNATGMQIMLRVQRGQSEITLNSDGSRNITYVYEIDTELSNFVISPKRTTVNILDNINRKNMPCLVSFIDDDAASDLFCSRYYNACMHNGITGAYAVQTDLLDSGVTTASKMLEYEQQGMGMLTHCSMQTSIYRADSEDKLKACLADLTKAKRKMIDYGFVTYNHFVIPYGTKSDDLRDIARYCGFESAISTSDNIMNRITDDDRYYIKRFGYVPQENYSTDSNSCYSKVLKLINEMVKIGAGWIIITTHFCDDWSASQYQWQTYPYDTTTDANGYEIGYTEFNDLVTAIKSTGAKIIPYTVGINYFHSGSRG